jgi:hypothetical protein
MVLSNENVGLSETFLRFSVFLNFNFSKEENNLII